MALYTFETDLDTGTGQTLGVTSSIALAVQLDSGVLMPAPWTATCSLMEPATDLTPPMGGPTQRISRLGSRWKVAFNSLPALGPVAAQALIALRALARASAQTLVFAWPQPTWNTAYDLSVSTDLPLNTDAGGDTLTVQAPGAPIGSPVVSGAGQLGTQLAASGFTPGFFIPAGTFFSFQSGGRTWLHCLTAPLGANNAGVATLSIAPMLRTMTIGGEVLNFTAPSVEGFIQGKSEDWTLQMLSWVGLPAFTVMEAA